METKLKVRVKLAYPNSIIKEGEVGEVQGYLMVDKDFAVAVVVFGNKIHTYPITWLEVVTDEQLMQEAAEKRERNEKRKTKKGVTTINGINLGPDEEEF